MQTVNIHEAKTHLSRLLADVARGESVVIARAGVPVARVIPIEPSAPAPVQRLGFLAASIGVPDDFDSLGAGLIEPLMSGEPAEL